MQYTIFNHTDGIPGPSPEPFETKEAAQAFIDRWRAALQKHQGYYSTNQWGRIPVDAVELEIRPLEEAVPDDLDNQTTMEAF